MNILTTTLLDLKNDRNGVVSVACDLNKLLEQDGHSVRVLSPYDDPGFASSVLFRVVRKVWRTTKAPDVFLLSLWLTLQELGKRVSLFADTADAVIAHDVLTAGAALKHVGGRCPVLLVCHFWAEPWEEFSDAGLIPHSGFVMILMRRLMEQALKDPLLALVPVSHRNELLLRRIIPDVNPQRIHLAYPGILPPKLTPLFTRSSADHTIIVNIGTLEPRKNQRLLPHVASALKQRGLDCRFVLAGPEDPEEKAHLMALLARLDVADMFTLWGKQDREVIFRLMTEADLYLHTSLQESFGMTLVEAMSCNIPVMALEYEALQEILPDTPEAIIPHDATGEQVFRIIEPFIRDHSRLASLQSRQRAVFERRFSSAAFLARYLEIIEGARRS